MTTSEQGDRLGGVPNQPKTPARAVRIDDATWDAVKAEAQARGETAADVVRRAIAEHLRAVERKRKK